METGNKPAVSSFEYREAISDAVQSITMFDQEDLQIANAIINATAATVEAVGLAKAFPVVLSKMVKLGWDAEEAATLTEMMIRNYSYRKTVVA